MSDRLGMGDIVRHPLGWMAVVVAVEKAPWLCYQPHDLWGTPEQMAKWEPSYAIEPLDNESKPGKYAWWDYPNDYSDEGNLTLIRSASAPSDRREGE